MPTRSRRSMASTACGSGISTCRCRSASPASSTIRTSSARSTRPSRRPSGTRSLSAGWCRMSSSGIDFYNEGFDFICYSGDVWVLHDALAEAIGKLRAGSKKK